MNAYLKENCERYVTFEDNVEEVISYVNAIENKDIYFPKDLNYIFVLFYTKYDTNNYCETVKYENEYVEFRNVISFGKYHFKTPEKIEEDDNNVYVIRKRNINNYDINLDKFNIIEFKNYVVVERK